MHGILERFTNESHLRIQLGAYHHDGFTKSTHIPKPDSHIRQIGSSLLSSVGRPVLHREAFRNDGFGETVRRDIVFHKMPAPVVVLFAVIFA